MVELTREIRGVRLPTTDARGVVMASSIGWLNSDSLEKTITQNKINVPHVSLLLTEIRFPGIIRPSPLLHLGLKNVKFGPHDGGRMHIRVLSCPESDPKSGK